MVLAIHWHESAMAAHMSPILNPLPLPSPPHPSGLSRSTDFECPASCIELALYFTYGCIHVQCYSFRSGKASAANFFLNEDKKEEERYPWVLPQKALFNVSKINRSREDGWKYARMGTAFSDFSALIMIRKGIICSEVACDQGTARAWSWQTGSVYIFLS